MVDQKTVGPVEYEVETLPEQTDLPAPVEGDQVGGVGSALAKLAPRRPSRLTRWLVRLSLALLTFAGGVWAWDFATGLMARSPVLGWVAVGLVAGLVVVLVALSVRELAALSRLSRVEAIAAEAAKARAAGDVGGARNVVRRVAGLYANRRDLAWGKAEIAEAATDLVDAGDILDHAERSLMPALDGQALAEVEAAAARVATITALVPVALADVAAALYSNVRMIRRIAEIYGGRAGTLGAWKLTRAVIAHLAATGAVAIGDDLIGSALGGGVLSKLSRRFGEGLVNGALTARVGIAAMELCRPLPFEAVARPRVSTTVRRALTGLISKGDRG